MFIRDIDTNHVFAAQRVSPDELFYVIWQTNIYLGDVSTPSGKINQCPVSDVDDIDNMEVHFRAPGGPTWKEHRQR